MQTAPRFTVISPSYQSAPYLEQAVSSLKAQTCGDFECILVVEESSDGSLERCQELSQGDSRFRVVPLPKSGSGSASYNYGIREARGEYIVFMDGDDWIEPQSLERFAAAIERQGGLDLLLASGREVSLRADGTLEELRRISNISKADEGRVITGRELIVKVGRAQNYQVLNICRAAFLREHGLYFAHGLQQEDTEWTPRVWYYAERVGALDFVFYNYRRRAGSVQSSCSPRLLRDFAKIVLLQLDFMESHELPAGVLSVWRNQLVSMVYWYFFHPQYISRFPKGVRREALASLMGDEAKWERFRRVARTVSLPKRLALPLVGRAARAGSWRWAEWYFKYLYYPMIKRFKS